MDRTDITILSLCSGVGMLDLGVDEAFRFIGCSPRVVGYCERDAYAAAILLARMEESALEQAPIWCGNLEQLPCDNLHGLVDCIVAGFPCQPWSAAGKREGTSDERWIFESICDIVRRINPEWLIFENVRGLITGRDEDDDTVADETGGGSVDQPPDGFVVGIANVLRSMADMGYDAEWGCLPASAVGASHKRERVFIVGRLANAIRCQRKSRAGRERVLDDGEAMCDSAHNNGRSRERGEEEGTRETGERRRGLTESSHDVADAAQRGQRIVVDAEQQGRSGHSDGGNESLADSERERGCLRYGGREYAIHADTCGKMLFAPGPSDKRWASIIERFHHLAPATEPCVRVLADGVAVVVDKSRNDQLRAIGNGVVPLQAAACVVELLRRMMTCRKR